MTDQNSAPAGTGATQPCPQDSVIPQHAALIGLALVGLGIIAFAAVAIFGNSLGGASLGFAAISGVMILSVSLYGLILLTRAIGMADATQALALPNGSVRALLALILAIVFIAVSSWTLGGLFSPLGPLVYTAEIAKTAEADRLALYVDKPQYVISRDENHNGDREIVKVYLKQETSSQLVDIAKQIVTISATLLVTIVGFYFGSKSVADSVRSAGDNIAAVGKAIASVAAGNATNKDGGDDDDDGADDTAPAPTADDIHKAANTAHALFASMQSAMTKFGDAPLTILHQAGDERDDVKDALATAVTSFATLNAKLDACADLAKQADVLAATPSSGDAKDLQAASANAQKLLADATQANHEFTQALAAFASARDTVLKVTAKG